MLVQQPEQFRKNLRKNLNTFLKNDKLAINLEIAIFNYCIQEAKNKKIVRKWDNKYFVQIYMNRFRSIYNNINPK